MRVENGKFKKESPEKIKEDYILRKVLTKALEDWFDLRLEDFPEIIEEIGIRSQDYDIIFIEQGLMTDIIFLKIKTVNKEYNIEVYRGKSDKSHAYFKIIENGRNKIFSVRRGVRVQQFR